MWAMAPLPELITTGAVAKQLAVSAATVQRWVREGLLDAITLPSGVLRFRQSDINALIEGTHTSPFARSSGGRRTGDHHQESA